MERQESRVKKIHRAKACNTCRRKKVKCDGKRPICSSCIIFKLPCGFEDTEKQPRRFTRAYVDELEQRVKHMDDEMRRLNRSEASLEQSNQVSKLHQAPTARTLNPVPNHPEPGSEREEILSINISSPDDESSRADLETSDQPSCVLRAQDGKMRFFGASSGFCMHGAQVSKSPMGRKADLGWHNTVRRGAGRWPLTNWIPRILRDDFEQRTTQSLPSKEATLNLVSEFLSIFNHTIPLVGETSIRKLAEKQFSWNPDDNPSSWALLNVVLAFSYKERAQASANANNDWQRSMGHIKNALNVLVELFLRNADLPAVQALLGLAIYFQGTPNAQGLFMLAASAMRLCHSIGLHHNTTSGFTSAEIDERRRTFWISFILDADISLRVGRPPVQDMEDYNTPLPDELPLDGRGIISIDGTPLNFFLQLAQFAKIQRLVYRHLQSVAATQRPTEVNFRSAKMCEEAILQWRSSNPGIFQPDITFSSEPESSREHLLRLYLAYHCCYASLRQPYSAISSNGTSHETQKEVDKEVEALCSRAIDSARSALELLPYVRLLASNYKWNVVYFFATASAALSSEIYAHPTRQDSKRDLSMVQDAIKFLMDVSYEEPGTFVDFILSICSDLERSAQWAVSKSQGDVAKSPTTGANDERIDKDINTLEQQQTDDITDSHISTGAEFLDTNSEVFNSQHSLLPFWNLDDMFITMP